ncbi:hypothetical protein DFJ74DRAFT_687556 [Hyaloraphidium curvatum]|nr:hypothetical protein DFJ74DRAFT_687556 [Hyaloraphidium curvatum]
MAAPLRSEPGLKPNDIVIARVDKFGPSFGVLERILDNGEAANVYFFRHARTIRVPFDEDHLAVPHPSTFLLQPVVPDKQLTRLDRTALDLLVPAHRRAQRLFARDNSLKFFYMVRRPGETGTKAFYPAVVTKVEDLPEKPRITVELLVREKDTRCTTLLPSVESEAPSKLQAAYPIDPRILTLEPLCGPGEHFILEDLDEVEEYRESWEAAVRWFHHPSSAPAAPLREVTVDTTGPVPLKDFSLIAGLPSSSHGEDERTGGEWHDSSEEPPAQTKTDRSDVTVELENRRPRAETPPVSSRDTLSEPSDIERAAYQDGLNIAVGSLGLPEPELFGPPSPTPSGATTAVMPVDTAPLAACGSKHPRSPISPGMLVPATKKRRDGELGPHSAQLPDPISFEEGTATLAMAYRELYGRHERLLQLVDELLTSSPSSATFSGTPASPDSRGSP